MKNPKKNEYEVGMIVEHPLRPQWGPGKVVAVTGDKVYVVFRDALERKAKVILRELATLGECESQSDTVLDRLPPVKLDGGDWLLPANYENLLNRALAAQALAAKALAAKALSAV